MSGVIDENGQQWERCNECAKFVKIETLRYEQPSTEYPCGRDLCARCGSGKPRGKKMLVTFEDGKLTTKRILEDQLSAEEAKRIRDEVRENVKKFGIQVRTMNLDGSWTDNSIPPEGD
jgi:hypothetical protein